MHEPTGFRIWFTRPLGIVTQMGHVSDVGDDLAEFVSTRSQAWLDERRRDGQRFAYVHDWRGLEKYSAAARKTMTDWALAVHDRAERIAIALRRDAKLARMGVSVATLALQVVGFRVEVVDDPQPTIDALGLRHHR